MGHYVNKIKSLANSDGYFETTVYGANIRTEVGHSANMFYGYKVVKDDLSPEGVFTTSENANAACVEKQHALASNLDSATFSLPLPHWPPMPPQRSDMREWTQECLAWGQRKKRVGFSEQEEGRLPGVVLPLL